MALLLHPQISLGEGPSGYLRRLSAANHLAISDLERLGVEFDIDVLREHKCAPRREQDPELDRYLRTVTDCLGESPASWIRRFSRFCPLCLGQQARWRVGWELLFADACPDHCVWLIDVCACGRVLTWDRSDPFRCDCGRAFRSQTPAACPDAVAGLSALLLDKALENPEASSVAPTGRLNISQLQRLVRYLGTYGDPEPGPKPQKISHQDRLAVSWRITSLAAEILASWPDCLYRILDRLQHERAADGGGRLTGRFGYLYTALYKAFPEDAFADLRNVFENYVADHWRGALGKRNRRLPAGVLQRAAWIPANHAIARLGISTARLSVLIAEGRIAGEMRTGPSGRRFSVVRREDVDRESKVLDGEVDLITAAEMLGLTKRRFQALLPLLFPEAYKTTNDASPWAIPRERLDRLVTITQGVKCEPALAAESTCLGYVLKYWAWTDSALADLLNALLAGELLPVGNLKGMQGVSGLIFRKSDLRNWHQETQQQTADIISLPNVAASMQVKEEVIYALARSGLLPVVVLATGTKRASQGVSRVALQAFGQRYIFARDLARSFGRSPRALIEELAILGLNPICGPKTDGCRQVLYETGTALDDAIRTLHLAGWDRK